MNKLVYQMKLQNHEKKQYSLLWNPRGKYTEDLEIRPIMGEGWLQTGTRDICRPIRMTSSLAPRHLI